MVALTGVLPQPSVSLVRPRGYAAHPLCGWARQCTWARHDVDGCVLGAAFGRTSGSASQAERGRVGDVNTAVALGLTGDTPSEVRAVHSPCVVCTCRSSGAHRGWVRGGEGGRAV